MDLNNLTLFNMANQKMQWLSQRQAVIADNVANSDTPGFMPSDVVAIDFSKELQKTNASSLKVTNPHHMMPEKHGVSAVLTDKSHIKGTLPDYGENRVSKEGRPFETSLDKNGVVVEEQMTKMAKSYHEYEISTTVYQKYTNMIKTALGKNSR